MITVDADHGGVIADYIARGPAIIRGLCESACTLALSYTHTCVYPQARLGVHPASTDAGTHLLWEMYPRTVRAWIKQHGGLHANVIYMNGVEAIRLGTSRCR